MSKKSEESQPKPIPTSTEIAMRGIRTDADFANVFPALIGDTLSGAINPNVTNAACNSAGKVLKMIELRQRYGSPAGGLSIGCEGNDPRASALAKLTVDERKALGL